MHTPHATIRILAISGSLRPGSSADAVITAAISRFPPQATVVRYEGLAGLPHFNDSQSPPQQVIDFRQQIALADGVLIVSPEYAFGVPGSLKNALDWTVSSGEWVNKPLALITAATGGQNAHAAWQLIFTALSANLAPGAALLISFIRSKMSAAAIVTDPATLDDIGKVTSVLVKTIETSRQNE